MKKRVEELYKKKIHLTSTVKCIYIVVVFDNYVMIHEIEAFDVVDNDEFPL